jgi:hypothetical protein
MTVNAERLTAATPDLCGMTARHMRDVHFVCQARNTFVLVRPSTPATMRLIGKGFATKSMDVHDKSSDWGLPCGLVPVDPAFDKNLKGAPNPSIHPHAHGEAEPVHLAFTPVQLDGLLAERHFDHTVEVRAGDAAFPVGDAAEYRCFSSAKRPEVQFLWRRSDGTVWWRAVGPPAGPPVEMWVWGYGGVPVTGDYDLWMVVPHVTSLGGDTDVYSVRDSHGRSAAAKFTVDLIRHLNSACSRERLPVFNHGAEAQNVSFTQKMDERVAVYTPGTMKPFMLKWRFVPLLLHDLRRHGYVAVRNPKWKDGVTLGEEDMAAAERNPDFAHDPGVARGKAALEKLQKSTLASLLARNPRFAGRFTAAQGADWATRYAEIRKFRHVAAIPEDLAEDVFLPANGFPATGAGSEAEAYLLAKEMGEAIEGRFGRSGFVADDDGHAVPVDASHRPASGSGLAAARARLGILPERPVSSGTAASLASDRRDLAGPRPAAGGGGLDAARRLLSRRRV